MTRISDITFGIGIVDGVTENLDSDSLSGHILEAKQFRVTSEGPVVRSQIGLSFGVRFRLTDPELRRIAYFQEVVTHPLMTNPKTKLTSTGRSEDKLGSNNDWNFTFYTFEYEWELATGEWTFEFLTLDDEPLAKITFEVS